MHISEGILTGTSMVATLAVGGAAVLWGLTRIQALVKVQPERKPVLAMAGAFIFLLSLTPFPAGPGTTTHPCGTPLAAILLGPGPTIVLASLSMLLQAAFFAHGGFTSWGANTLTLGLFGGLSGWLVYRGCRKAGMNIFASAALAGAVGDLMTYVGAGGILATHLAYFVDFTAIGQSSDDVKKTLQTFANLKEHGLKDILKFIYIAYLPAQLPLALGEALITGYAVRSIARQRPEVLESLKVEPKGFAVKAGIMGLALFLFLGTSLKAAEHAGEAAMASTPTAVAVEEPAGFTGMDELVNEAIATAGGAPPRDPYINLEAKGDIWNMVLLLGGGLAGFVIGRNWHHLFGVRRKD